MRRQGPARVAIGLVVGVPAALLLFLHECASGGAMGGAYRRCTCRGVEWLIEDATAADGPRRTACFGLISQRTCYRMREGPEIPCASVR